MRYALLILFAVGFSISCADQKAGDKSSMKTTLTEAEIIEHIKKAINPEFKNWVVFSNGTYIIIEDSTITDSKKKAIEIMKEYGPVYPGSPAGDISITKLSRTDGWVVGGYYYGMYTYVSPREMEKENPGDIDVGLWGRQKRGKDAKELKVIYVNE